MRRALPLIGILLLAPLLAASTSSAQEGLGQVAVTLDSTGGSAPQGGHATTGIRIANQKLHDVTIDFWKFDSRDVYIDLGRDSVVVEAGREFVVPARLLVAHDAALGGRNVNVRVIERPSGITANDTWEVSYRLNVTGAVPTVTSAPAQPVVSPQSFADREAYYGVATHFEVAVRNPGAQAENFSLVTLTPKGWDVAGATHRALTYAAGEEKRFNLSIVPGTGAADGPMRVFVVNNANVTRAAFADGWLRAGPAPNRTGDVTTPVEPTFRIDVDPARAQAEPESSALFTVRVSGTREAEIDLALENVTEGFHASIGLRTATIGPSMTHQTSMGVTTPSHEGVGEVTIVGRARDTGETFSTRVFVDVVGSAPRLDLRIDPETQEGAAGDELRYLVTIGSTHARTVYLGVTNQSGGIDLRLSQSVFEIPANGTATANVTLRVLQNATGDGFFVLRAWKALQERDAHAVGRLALRQNATEPPPVVEPPANETPVERPPLVNETLPEEPPANDTEPPTPPPLRIEVDPAEVVIQPGGSAQAVARVTSRGDASIALALELALPRGISAAPAAPPPLIAPNETIEILIVLTASDTLEPNATHAAEVRAQNAQPGPFTIRVGEPPLPPPPPEDDDTASTNSASASAPLGLTPILAGAAAGVGAGALGFAYAKRKWPFALAALYAKLRPSKVLDHEARRRIAEMARAEPGITMGELQRRLGLANGEIAHHLHVLERARVLTSARDGQLRRVYATEHGRAPRVPDLGDRALAALAQQPRTASQLARDLGVTRQALHYHLKKLYAERRIEPLPDGTIRAAGAAERAAGAPEGVLRS